MAFCITVFITEPRKKQHSMKLSNTISYCSSAQKSQLFRQKKSKKKYRHQSCLSMYVCRVDCVCVCLRWSWYGTAQAGEKKSDPMVYGEWSPGNTVGILFCLKYCRLKPFEFTTFHIMAKIIPEHFATDSLYCAAAAVIGPTNPEQGKATLS